jgi:hypothetical protein
VSTFSSYANGAMPGIFTAVANNLTSAGRHAVISGGYAVDPGGGTLPGYSAMYNVATTTSDQQIVSGVFSGVTSSNRAFLMGRAIRAGTSFVYAYSGSGPGICGSCCRSGGRPGPSSLTLSQRRRVFPGLRNGRGRQPCVPDPEKRQPTYLHRWRHHLYRGRHHQPNGSLLPRRRRGCPTAPRSAPPGRSSTTPHPPLWGQGSGPIGQAHPA